MTNPLKETPIFRQRSRPEPSPRAKQIIENIHALDSATKDCAPKLTAAESTEDKRVALKGILLALTGLGLVISLPGKANATIGGLGGGGGNIDDLIDSIGNIEGFMQDLLELLNRALAIVPGVALPPFVRQMIMGILRDLIGLAGDDSFSGDDPVGAIGISFPDDPAVVETPNARRAFGETKLAALRARGEEAVQQAAQVTAGQEQMSIDEETIALEAGATGNLIAIGAAQLALTASNSARAGTLAFTLQAMNTLLADPHLERHAEMRLKSWADQQILGPIPEPAPVGILPGGN